MEELVMTLVGEARMQEAVAMNALDNGLQLFAYPLQDGMLVALGVGPEAAVQVKDILQRRASDMRRFGGWLPSMFNDGSIYLLRRLTPEDEEGGSVLRQHMRSAEELLK